MQTVEAAAAMAYRLGKKVVLNPAPASKLSAGLLETLYAITPNETEAEAISGIRITDERTAEEAARKIASMGVCIYSGWPFASQWSILPAGHTNDEWRELLIGSLRSNCAIMELYSIESASIMGEAAPHYITVYYRNADSEPTDDLRSLELYFD